MQEESTGYLGDPIGESLKKYIEQQNSVKLEKATSIIIICGVFGWPMCARFFGEFDPDVVQTKNIFYLVCTEAYGDSEDHFLERFGNIRNDDNHKELFSRVFFSKDSEEHIINAIKRTTKAE